MNFTIKNVPEWVYKALKRGAAEQGRSLNAEAIMALTWQAEEIERHRKMRETRPELERFVASLPKLSSSVPLIREDRRRH
jgi:plasmid stability protein